MDTDSMKTECRLNSVCLVLDDYVVPYLETFNGGARHSTQHTSLEAQPMFSQTVHAHDCGGCKPTFVRPTFVRPTFVNWLQRESKAKMAGGMLEIRLETTSGKGRRTAVFRDFPCSLLQKDRWRALTGFCERSWEAFWTRKVKRGGGWVG